MKDHYSVTISSQISSRHFHVRRTFLQYVMAVMSCVLLVVVTSGAANFIQWGRISSLTEIRNNLSTDLEVRERQNTELKQTLQGYSSQIQAIGSELRRIETDHGAERGELMFTLEERIRMIGDLVMRYRIQTDDIYDELIQLEDMSGANSEGTALTIPERIELIGDIMSRHQDMMDDLYAELNLVEKNIEVHHAEGDLAPHERIRIIGQAAAHYAHQSEVLHNELDFVGKRIDTDTGDATLSLEERMQLVSDEIERYYGQSQLLQRELDSMLQNTEENIGNDRSTLEHRMLLLSGTIDRYYKHSEFLLEELDLISGNGGMNAGDISLEIQNHIRLVSESIDRYFMQSEALHDELDHITRISSTDTGNRSQSLEKRIRKVSQGMQDYYSQQLDIRDELGKIEKFSQLETANPLLEPYKRVRKIGELLLDYTDHAKSIRDELDRVERLSGEENRGGQLDSGERIERIGRSVDLYRDQLVQIDRELNRIIKYGELSIEDAPLEERLHAVSNLYYQKDAFFRAVEEKLQDIEELIGLSETEAARGGSEIEIGQRMEEVTLSAAQQRVLHDNAPSGYPMDQVTITSGYGMRIHPVTSTRAFHHGIDMRAAVGEEVYVTANGVVSSVVSDRYYGKMIEVMHSYGFMTVYAHLSKMLVEPGDFVYKGDVIGYSGNTGRSNGPHLHYEIRYLGNSQNPDNFLEWGIGENEIFTKVDNVKWQSLLNQINRQITHQTLQLSQLERISPER